MSSMSPPAFYFTLILTLTFDPALWPWHLVTFDLDPFDLWPLNHTNAPNKVKKQNHKDPMSGSVIQWCCVSFGKGCKCENHVFQHGGLDLWPMTLSFTNDLDMVHVHHHTKFGDHRSNGSWDIIFFLVTFSSDGQTDRRRRKRAHRAWAQVG